MEGVFVNACIVALQWLAPCALAVADFVPPGIEALPIDGNAPRGRSYLQAAMTKLRPGAMLKADVPPFAAPPELLGQLGKGRDEVVTGHYARIAELDYLADQAGKEHDGRLAERIEMVRRSESQHFFRQMQRLQSAVRAFWERRLP